LVILPSHRLPSGDVALLKGLLIDPQSLAAEAASKLRRHCKAVDLVSANAAVTGRFFHGIALSIATPLLSRFVRSPAI
jgi:hypothetical protein